MARKWNLGTFRHLHSELGHIKQSLSSISIIVPSNLFHTITCSVKRSRLFNGGNVDILSTMSTGTFIRPFLHSQVMAWLPLLLCTFFTFGIHSESHSNGIVIFGWFHVLIKRNYECSRTRPADIWKDSCLKPKRMYILAYQMILLHIQGKNY